MVHNIWLVTYYLINWSPIGFNDPKKAGSTAATWARSSPWSCCRGFTVGEPHPNPPSGSRSGCCKGSVSVSRGSGGVSLGFLWIREFRVLGTFGCPILGGSWVAISGVISPLIWVIIAVTLL